MTKQDLQRTLESLPKVNPWGEPVRLVAATKMQTIESIALAVECGVTAIGENKVQEFLDKYESYPTQAEKHFIGHLQTNKVKYLIGKTQLIHSVSSLRLAEEISTRSQKAGIITDVLLQINIGKEDTKGGFLPQETDDAVDFVTKLPALRVQGLMAMLPHTDDKDALCTLARQMRDIYEKHCKAHDFTVLSMGMSADYELAVKCGSNMIRLGNTLFGPRPYPVQTNAK